MRVRRLSGSTARLMLVATLIIAPAAVLAYLGYSSIADREEAMRAANAATATLIRDRVLAELASRVDAIERSVPPLVDLASSTAASSWLRAVADRQPWIDSPFVLTGQDRLMGVDIWSGTAEGRRPQLDDEAANELRAAERAELVGPDLTAALAHYRRAASLSDDVVARVFLQSRIARALWKQRRVDDAIAAYRELVDVPVEHAGPTGLPLALVAREQIADILAEAGRPSDERAARVDLLEWLLDHPWDLQAGYGYYVERAVTLATAAPDAVRARAARVVEAVRLADDVRSAMAAVRGQDDPPRAPTPGSTRYVRLGDDRARSLGLHDLGSSAGIPTVFGFVVSADSVAALLETVLAGVDLGSDRQTRLVDGRGRPSGTDAPVNVLAAAPTAPALPDWQVAIVDTQGRSLTELAARERWTSVALVAGAVVALLAGVVVTGRAWMRETQLARLRTDFVSNVSHELKTPLALIRMFGETLESGMVADANKRQEFYGIIRRESERLTHLIDNVLDAAKIEAGTKAFSLTNGDLGDVVRDVVEAYRPLLARLGFRLDAAVPPEPLAVAIDRDAVAQALVNLMQNAIKYSGDARDIRVAVVTTDSEARVQVTDHGVGIDAREIPHIFEAYYRVSSGDTSAPAGSGLGLSIVQHVMRAHGGRVDVTSEPGHGSTFGLVFPLAAPAAEHATARSAPVRREALS